MFVEVGGHRVHVVAGGPGPRTVVGISGAFGTHEIWEQPFELLSRRHHVVAYDHLGAGLTEVAPDAVTFEAQVELVQGLLDRLEIDACVLAGDSNMVAVAVEAAARWPERVAGLALVSGGVVHHPDDLVVRFVHGLRSNFDVVVEQFAAICLPEPGSEHLRRWLRAIIARTGGERAAILLESFYGVDVSHRLPELKLPAVVVHGDEDALPTSPVAGARAVADALPGGRLEVLEGVGHVPTLTRPFEVARVIEQLIEEAWT